VAESALLWALLHVVKAALSTPLAALSDRTPRRTVIAAGWLVYAATYAGFAVASAPWHAWGLFALYGVHFALVEGAEKALVADLAPPSVRGRAFGVFHFVVGSCSLPASLGFGLIFEHRSPAVAFAVGAGLAALAAGLIARFGPRGALAAARGPV
jgi:MFS family permease